MSKTVNMNTRMKSIFSRLHTYMSPSQIKYETKDKKHNILFVLKNKTLKFSFKIFDFEKNESLNIDDQRMLISYTEVDDNNQIIKESNNFNEFSHKEAKAILNDMLETLQKVPFWCLGSGQETAFYVNFPKIMNHLFEVEESNKDFDKIFEIMNDEIEVFLDQKIKTQENKSCLDESKKEYQKELDERSNQPEIEKLKRELDILEKKEDDLKKELDQKYKLTHNENVSSGYQNQSHKKTMTIIQSISETIKEHNLEVDFNLVCNKIGIK